MSCKTKFQGLHKVRERDIFQGFWGGLGQSNVRNSGFAGSTRIISGFSGFSRSARHPEKVPFPSARNIRNRLQNHPIGFHRLSTIATISLDLSCLNLTAH